MARPKHAGIVLPSGFQELELWYPTLRLREEGIKVTVIGDRPEHTTFSALGYPVLPQVSFENAPDDCDLVFVPGTTRLLPGALAERISKVIASASRRGAQLAATSSSIALATAHANEKGAGEKGKILTAAGPDELPALLRELLGPPAKTLSAQVAVLCEHQFQELELWHPVLRLREAGCNVLIVGPSDTQIFGSKLGYPVTADLSVEQVSPDDFDAIVVPGGFAPEGLRRSAAILDLVRGMNEQGSLIATICHAGWVLASADIARGRRLTCVSIIKDDMKHAGAHYVDEPVVRDGNLITSRLPGDLPEFGRAIVEYLATEPSRRRGSRHLVPSRRRHYASAAYKEPANVVMAARAPASANYIWTVVDGPAQ